MLGKSANELILSFAQKVSETSGPNSLSEFNNKLYQISSVATLAAVRTILKLAMHEVKRNCPLSERFASNLPEEHTFLYSDTNSYL